MPTSRRSLILALGALCSAMAGGALAAPPTARSARPVRVAPQRAEPLPPAVIDNQLAIGGEDINAKKIETRLTVEVSVTGAPGTSIRIIDQLGPEAVVPVDASGAGTARWTTQSRYSSFVRAEVRRLAKSDPASGSEKP